MLFASNMNPSEIARMDEEAEQPTEPFDVLDFLEALRIERECHGFEPPTQGGIRPLCYRCGLMTMPPLWVCDEPYCSMRSLG